MRAGPTGVWGLQASDGISREAFRRIVGKPSEGMSEEEVRYCLRFRFSAQYCQ